MKYHVLILGVVVLGATAAGLAGSVSAPAAPATAPTPLPAGDWEKHGLSAAARTELRALLAEQVRQQKIPGGAVLLVHKGEVIFAEGFGWANIREQRPFLVTDPVRIASITKPVVATGILALAAEGKFSLDEPISKWLPEFKGIKLLSGQPASRAPTLRELLSHTGGAVPDESPQGRPWFKDWVLGKPDITLAEVVAHLCRTGMAWEPRAKFGYSGSGYDIAVCAVEAATGKRFETMIGERIFQPLGMTRTTFRPDAATTKAIPQSYNLTARGLVPGSGRRLERTADNYVTYGGSLVATPEDLAKLLLLHLQEGQYGGKQIIPRDLMLAAHEKPSWSKTSYGLGWSLGRMGKDGRRATIGHSGSSGTYAWIDFEKQLVGVVFTQMPAPKSDTGGKKQRFWQLVREKVDAIFATPGKPASAETPDHTPDSPD